jgi:hypothetical protein
MPAGRRSAATLPSQAEAVRGAEGLGIWGVWVGSLQLQWHWATPLPKERTSHGAFNVERRGRAVEWPSWPHGAGAGRNTGVDTNLTKWRVQQLPRVA